MSVISFVLQGIFFLYKVTTVLYKWTMQNRYLKQLHSRHGRNK